MESLQGRAQRVSAPGSLSDLESRGGGVAGMTTLGRCSWAAREKESHGLLPLYVALVTKAPAEVALAVLEAYPKLLLNGKWQDISARGARSLRRSPPVAA